MHINTTGYARLVVYISDKLTYRRGHLMEAKEESNGPPHIVIKLREMDAMFLYNEYSSSSYSRGGGAKLTKAKILSRMEPILKGSTIQRERQSPLLTQI